MNQIPLARGRRLAIATLLLIAAPGAFAQHFGPWGNPQPAAGINTAASEGCPIEAPDGLGVYIASNRAGGYGNLDIWRAFRASVDAPWGPAENLGPVINSGDADYCPTPMRGRWMAFVTSLDTELDDDPANDDCKPGPADVPPSSAVPVAGDMYLTQEFPHDGWRAPLHLGCYPDGPNTAGAEFSPSMFESDDGETYLYFSSNGYPDSQGQDIYVSRVLADGTVTAGMRVNELSGGADDRMPNVRRGGLEIVYSSNRGNAAGDWDIYVATRASIGDPWDTPQRIANPLINTLVGETRPSLSGDGTRLYFGRAGEVYVSTRERLRGSSH